jgi:hypothetical protein
MDIICSAANSERNATRRTMMPCAVWPVIEMLPPGIEIDDGVPLLINANRMRERIANDRHDVLIPPRELVEAPADAPHLHAVGIDRQHGGQCGGRYIRDGDAWPS